jgi:transcription initiation factor TFIID subunit 6
MATTQNARAPGQEGGSKAASSEQRLLWNPENVRDVAESVGIATLNDEALRTLSQDVEYRIGQVLAEALRFMRYRKRTTMTVLDVSLALRVLDVEPLYGYDSTKSLRYGEATMGQPFFYIDDEEADFERVINGALPKVPRDANYTSTSPRRQIASSIWTVTDHFIYSRPLACH